jgi:uncharacterized metal-binding protein YceD (DUF177 family)
MDDEEGVQAEAELNEWSYLVEEDEIGSKPVKLEIYPSDKELSALARRLEVLSFKSLKAPVTLRRLDGSMVVHVKGRIVADLTQKCVVSMEAVAEHIDEEFEAWFADPGKAVSFAKAKRDRLSDKEKEEHPVLEEQDDPEPIIDGKIDLGELVTQYLSLFLNPYPRADGVELKNEGAADEQSEEGKVSAYDNPFAALKEWKARKGRNN